MYAVSSSAEGDCYVGVPPDPGIEAAALGASESATPGADRTTLTPLSRPVAVSLADPSGGPVLAHYSTVLPCPAAPSGSLSGLYLPSFSTNLVAASSQVFAAASQSGPESVPSSCRLLSHQTLLWHHRLGHPSLPRLRGMASRVLVSGLPRSLPPLPPRPAPTYVPCIEGRQRAAPHSSEFPPTEAPLQTLHMDVWGPAHVRGQGHERYFLLVIDDYSRYTTVFPLRRKGEVTEVLIDWIRVARLQLRESFSSDFPVLRLHSDRGGEFSSDLLRAFCRAEGIHQTFTLPASPQQNGIAEGRVGMVMDVARTSMIHAAAPHFLWPFAVQYAAHQINLQPWVSQPETSPTLQWTGKVGDVSAFRVWGSRAFVRDLSADKLSSRAVPCVFLGFPPDAPGLQFYHPTSRRVLSSQDVTFDESVPYYRRGGRLHLGGRGRRAEVAARLVSASRTPLPSRAALFRELPGGTGRDRPWRGGDSRWGPSREGLGRGGPRRASSSRGDLDRGVVGVFVVSVAEPERAEPVGAGPGGIEHEGGVPGGARSRGAELERAEPGGAGSGSAEPGVADSGGAVPASAGHGGPSRALSRRELPSPQELREWFARRWSRAAGAGGSTSAGGAGATGLGGARTGGTRAAGPGGATGAGATGGAGAGGAAGEGATGGTGAGAAASAGGPAGAGAAGGTGAGGAIGAGAPVGAGVGAPGAAGGTTSASGAGGVGADAGGAGVVPAGFGGAARPRPYFVPLLEQVLGLPSSSGPAPSLECPPPVPSESQLQLASPLPAPSPFAGPTGGLAERREPESRPASPVRTARTSRRVPQSSLPALVDPESDSLCAASRTVTRFLATAVTDPSFESTAASALVSELVDFAAHYATSLVAESASVCPPSIGGACALSTDVFEDRQEEFHCFAASLPHLVSMLLAPEGDPDAPDIPTPRSYAEAIEGPYSSQWQAAMDAEMASWKVKRPSGSPPVFKARYVARGFSQRQGVEYFQTFSPTPKMTTLRVLLHVAAQRDYELHSLDFSTAFLQGSLHEEIWLRRPPGFTGTTLAALGFAPSTTDPSLFLRIDTTLPPFYILMYVNDLVFATADTAGLAHVKSELQKRHMCTDLGELRSYLGLQITRDRAQHTITLTQSHMVQQVLQRFDFTYSSPQATPLSTRHSLSALPSDESVEPSGPYPELVGCLMYLMTCTRPDLAYPLSILARYVAPGRHRPEHMTAAERVLRYLCSTSGMGLVLGGRSLVVLTGHADASSCEAEIYPGAMAAQELRWLTYLLFDLGEPLHSPPVLYVDNKAMLALCREHRLEHKTRHISLCYFLARELQQRGRLRLAYVASQANTADIFTKALQPCDHQRFCTMLGLVPTWPHLLTS
ncbi:unnamed protein product [Closterium sp. NIES-53]